MEDKNCLKCESEDDSCLECQDNNICLKCRDGYRLESPKEVDGVYVSKCIKCPDFGCKTCGDNVCKTCYSGFFLDQG